jgi:hypothetical protein
MSALAEQYEKRHPETGIPEAQKEERMERLLFKQERQSLRRTKRARGIVVPPLPWKAEQ